ncbi:hypothetical protein EWM64_g3524 [Hericium alpestre]|uniref:DUF572-domain-containing protein n=1 Tax=Hericium alpestre TaxID=135208 RepID=A0A4Z0A476_9AGAM|nr:hypothetical protein EWM64_g3524 [Hericium alpestre]
MQGFNKYYPPDYDGGKHKSLNAYRGKHALGDRARKIGEGILITRFELPFNIWCGTCNAHIGMGVRYNAEKKKIGNYYSTPIFSFRCKCHLCSGWFEIQTDPKNTRYVVTSGARQKDEDWDPEENGGFAIHDTEGKADGVDPLAALEKTTEARDNITKVQAPRLEQLQDVSDHYGSDPYSLSRLVRKRFREEKKIEKRKAEADDGIKKRYGLPSELALIRDDEEAVAAAKDEWERGRAARLQHAKCHRVTLDAPVLPSGSSRPRVSASGSATTSSKAASSSALNSLRTRILSNSSRQSDPFAMSSRQKPPDTRLAGITLRRD